MFGISGINIELTSKCNKSCFMCGRRKMERDYPGKCDWGDMAMATLRLIAKQIPKGIFIQLHWNGEPLVYPDLAEALKLFAGHYVGLDTNAKLLMEKNKPVRDYLSTVTISVIPDDPEGGSQLLIAGEFLEYQVRPLVVFRLLGEIDDKRRRIIQMWAKKYPMVIACNRVLHAPEGSRDYEKPVTIPEIGVCLEVLHKLAIDQYGDVYPCVRYNPEGLNCLGNVENYDLSDIAAGKKRIEIIKMHLAGRRSEIPLCQDCDFWGIPIG